MAGKSRSLLRKLRAQKLSECRKILATLGFGPKQSNEVAAYTLLALLGLEPQQTWSASISPLRGITPIIRFINEFYGVEYAPNTRETIRDEAVKHFVEAGMLIRNPDDPSRPVTSGRTVYQLEPQALDLCRSFGTVMWAENLTSYLASRELILRELGRERSMVRIPVTLPSGDRVTISPGGQNPLIKSIIEEFCPRFVPGGHVIYLGDAENKFLHLDATYLANIGVTIQSAAKIPDVIVHDRSRNWLLLIEAVTSAGPIDGKRRSELKDLFRNCSSGLIFVTAFATIAVLRSFLTNISWETEVWIAENPDHIIHFDGERFLGPYPDVNPTHE